MRVASRKSMGMMDVNAPLLPSESKGEGGNFNE